MEQKLSTGFKFRFALAELGFTTLRAVMDFFLLYYYTDVAGINPAVVGSALLVGKLSWDAINDPLVGYWSDRTRSRFGRRRIYMLIAALPIAIGTWIQFSLPFGLTGVTAFLAVLLTFWLKDTFVTMAVVPYASLIAEVTHSYQERSSLGLYKGISAVFGYILGAGTVTLLAGMFRGAGLNLQQAWGTTAAIFGVFAVVTLLITALTVKERADLAGEPSTIPPLKGNSSVFKEPLAFVLLTVIFVLGSGLAHTVQAAFSALFDPVPIGYVRSVDLYHGASLVTTGIFAAPAKILADKYNKGPAYAHWECCSPRQHFCWLSSFLPHHATPWVYVMAVFAPEWPFPPTGSSRTPCCQM